MKEKPRASEGEGRMQSEMAEEAVSPLIKVVYYDNCAGCKQDQRKQANRGLPLRELLFIWVVTLAAGNLLWLVTDHPYI